MNPVSGRMILTKYFADITRILHEADYSLDVRCTTQVGDACEIVKKSAAENDIIICCGGDGTLNDIVNGVMAYGKPIDIGYIPCGTTNDFAASIGLTDNIIKATRDVVNGVPTTIDVGQFDSKYFAYVASFGAFTKSSYSTPQDMKNSLGHFAYILRGITELAHINPVSVTVTTESGEVHSGEYLVGFVSNSTSVAGIIKIDQKHVDMADGLFEVMLVKFPKNILEFNTIISSVTAGKYNNKFVDFFRAREITVQSQSPIQWSLDGERYDAKETGIIKNCHKAINIILPND